MSGILDLTSRTAVLEAIAEFDQLGRERFLAEHNFGPALSYFIVHEERRYDSKAIAGVAYGNQFPEDSPLGASDFSGGHATVQVALERLGFTVSHDPSNNEPTAAVGSALRDALSQVLGNLVVARGERFARHPLADFIRNDLPSVVRAIVANDGYQVEGSPGKGNWAEVVWVCVFDRRVTTTAQEGFFLVYLFDPAGDSVHLSLNQGTTAVIREATLRRYVDVLTATAARDKGLLAAHDLSGLSTGPLDLGGNNTLTRGYAAGNIVATSYHATDLPLEALLVRDLERMLRLYQELVTSRDQLSDDAEDVSIEVGAPAIEARRMRWHQRAERNRRLARDAKRAHGDRCMVCDQRMNEIYGEQAGAFLDAHHLKPFAQLDGAPTSLDPKHDFAVVCPNCHRFLHKGPPFTIAEARATLRRVASAD